MRKIYLFLLIGIIVSFSCQEEKGSSTEQRPNVIFIISDDLNDWVEPLQGHPQVKTPNISRLANRSYTFRNAHSNAPLCSPSRASLFSGLYPHTTEYYGYGQNDGHTWRKPPLLQDAVTLIEHFHNHGYQVLGTGKIMHNMHHQEELFRYEGDTLSGHGPPANFGPWPWNGKEKMPHPGNKPPFGDRFMAGIAPLSDVPSFPPDPQNDIPGYTGWRQNWAADEPFHYNNEEDRSLMPDEKSAKWAVEQLSNKSERPFLMVVGFNRPHVPLYAPKKFFDMYPVDEVQLPPGFKEDDLDDVAPSQNEPSSAWKKMQANYEGDSGFRMEVQGYLACVSFIDAQVGKILDALESSRHAKNTIVIFTSDHGYHNFEKKYLGKRTPWERSTRIPLFVHLPGQSKPFFVDHPVELIDVFPTLNALCALPNDPNKETNGQPLDGNNLEPFFDNPDQPLSDFDYAISAVFGKNSSGAYDSFPVPKEDLKFTVRSKNYRYIHTHMDEEEFYDHSIDPHEWYNKIQSSEYANEITRHRKLVQDLLDK